MPIYASDTGGGKDFKKIPPGCYFSICNMVVDLGVQEAAYKGEKKQQHKVYLRFEVPDQRTVYEPKDGPAKEGPMCIGATYTLSLGEKANLRRILENWRGKLFTPDELKQFDITKVAGTACQVMVQHESGADGKSYANITGVMGTSQDQKERARTVKAENEILIYSIDDHDDSVYKKLPNWIKEKLEKRVVPRPKTLAEAAGVLRPADDFDDDQIPF